MAECRYMPDWHEIAVYYDDLIAGFSVYCLDPDDNEYWISAFMIDEKYQHKGYGRAALKELILLIIKKRNRNKIYIGHRPENVIASHLYESSGFVDTGRRYGGEIIRCLEIKV
jgi:diamine N-acetyltransferase